MRRALLAAVVISALLTLAGYAQAATVHVRVKLSNGIQQNYAVSGSALTGSGYATNGKTRFTMSVTAGAFQGNYLLLQGVFSGEQGAKVPDALYVNRANGNAFWVIGTQKKTTVSGKASVTITR